MKLLNKVKNTKFQKSFISLSTLEKGEIISNWKFGIVYEVKDKNEGYLMNAMISKKKLNDYSTDELSYYIDNLNVISKINHPSIIKAIGYSPTNFNNLSNPMLITEPLIGNLSDYINFDFNITQKLIIIYGIASAMSYLHSHDIVHRDLSPSSILIDHFYHPKITNFGFTTNRPENSRYCCIELTEDPYYCSPEILKNEIYLKPCNVYSFSLIVFRLITGQNPFGNIRKFTKFCDSVAFHDERPKIPDEVPYCFHSLIEKCWSKNPKERPTFDQIVEILEQNINEFMEALQKYLK